ncbi:hypothetical protein A1O3_06648 [Capronia epimyces CBS 606.96]|uniref:Zn(2)-C6 fungal-type domain-containing protein n=1 Tax=Capronia epimyces CBS 606.96 TaxID=1182542 RepID=W9XRL5_9EURO|nr:uncharacterized protein A1O3_06648 [Capronia epimyces CBS 606.96]EXJ82833.1 hypothetical protein A1O3_06648 [Capronia epimyces CBS 606.96]
MIRIGKEKVRTGCITCKRRHVKCDEARPACHRCTRAGRACEGYASTSTPGSGNPQPIRFVVYGSGCAARAADPHIRPHPHPHPHPRWSLPEHPDLDWLERRALDYFQDRTALELAGAFQTDFWLASILPLARHENSVKYALIALSSMHEHYAGIDHFAPARGGLGFALDHYGKAIREVVRLNQNQNKLHNHAQKQNQSSLPTITAKNKKTFDYALVTCALFSAFESLQGHYHDACKHAVAGIKILAEEQQQEQQQQAHRPSQHQHQHPPVIPRDELNRFFIAMGRQMLEIGDPNLQGLQLQPVLGRGRGMTALQPHCIPDQFVSYEHALLHIEILLTDLFEFSERSDRLHNHGQGRISDGNYHSLRTEYVSLKARFDTWKAGFDAMVSNDSNDTKKSQEPSWGGGSASASSSASISASRSPAPPFASASSAVRESEPEPKRSLLSSPSPSFSSSSVSSRPPAFLILRMYQAIITAFLSRIEQNDEAALNNFLPDFWTAVAAAEEFLEQTTTFVSPVHGTAATAPTLISTPITTSTLISTPIPTSTTTPTPTPTPKTSRSNANSSVRDASDISNGHQIPQATTGSGFGFSSTTGTGFGFGFGSGTGSGTGSGSLSRFGFHSSLEQGPGVDPNPVHDHGYDSGSHINFNFNINQSRIVRPTFSLALGIVPTLFLTATRTTDRALRAKALHLLRTCNRREGFWDSRIAAKLAERVVEIREEVRAKAREEVKARARIVSESMRSGGCHMDHFNNHIVDGDGRGHGDGDGHGRGHGHGHSAAGVLLHDYTDNDNDNGDKNKTKIDLDNVNVNISTMHSVMADADGDGGNLDFDFNPSLGPDLNLDLDIDFNPDLNPDVNPNLNHDVSTNPNLDIDSNPNPNPNHDIETDIDIDIDIKLLDVSFLPGKKCTFRYAIDDRRRRRCEVEPLAVAVPVPVAGGPPDPDPDLMWVGEGEGDGDGDGLSRSPDMNDHAHATLPEYVEELTWD